MFVGCNDVESTPPMLIVFFVGELGKIYAKSLGPGYLECWKDPKNEKILNGEITLLLFLSFKR